MKGTRGRERAPGTEGKRPSTAEKCDTVAAKRQKTMNSLILSPQTTKAMKRMILSPQSDKSNEKRDTAASTLALPLSPHPSPFIALSPSFVPLSLSLSPSLPRKQRAQKRWGPRQWARKTAGSKAVGPERLARKQWAPKQWAGNRAQKEQTGARSGRRAGKLAIVSGEISERIELK